MKKLLLIPALTILLFSCSKPSYQYVIAVDQCNGDKDTVVIISKSDLMNNRNEILTQINHQTHMIPTNICNFKILSIEQINK